MLPLPDTQTRTDGGSLRRAPRCAGAPGRAAPVAADEEPKVRLGPPQRLPPAPPPCPQGEEQLMETCDFFHQWTQTHPSPAQGGAGGGAPGGKKLFLEPRRVAQVIAPGGGGPPAGG